VYHVAKDLLVKGVSDQVGFQEELKYPGKHSYEGQGSIVADYFGNHNFAFIDN
jgi:hypothetical protein